MCCIRAAYPETRETAQKTDNKERASCVFCLATSSQPICASQSSMCCCMRVQLAIHLKEGCWVTEAFGFDKVGVRGKAVSPIGPNPALACAFQEEEHFWGPCMNGVHGLEVQVSQTCRPVHQLACHLLLTGLHAWRDYTSGQYIWIYMDI